MSRQMKDSGIEWIGSVPETWEIKRVKYGFIRQKDEAHLDEPIVLSLARSGVKVRDISNNEGQLAESYYNYNPVEPGDLLLNPMDLYSGANCSVSKVSGVISPAYINLRAKKGYNSAFFDYYFKTQYWAMAMFAHGKGVSFDNRWTLNANDLLNYFIPVPNLEEQDRIVSYLDSQCAHIDTVIEKTKASIEEYKKLKQAVITQAVTKGVRGDRPMKDSGNVWLGEIPIELMVSRVGLLFDIILGKMVCTEPKESNMTEYPYICAANVHFDGVDTINLKKMWFTENEIRLYEVKEGDLLVVEGGAGAGGCAIAREIEEIVGIQNSIQIVRPKNENSTEYLCYLLQALVKQKYVDVVCNKATIPHFTKDKLATVPFIMWSYEEQCEIVNYLDKKCNEIDILISSKEKFLDELVDYKKSLIYEYITGKKEVPVS